MGDALDRARAAMHAVPGPQSCSLQGLQPFPLLPPPSEQQEQHDGAGAGMDSGSAKRKSAPMKADTFSAESRYTVCEHCKFMGDSKQLHKKTAQDEEGGVAAAAVASVVAAAGGVAESSGSPDGGSSMSAGLPTAAAIPTTKTALGVSSSDIGGMRAELPVSGED